MRKQRQDDADVLVQIDLYEKIQLEDEEEASATMFGCQLDNSLFDQNNTDDLSSGIFLKCISNPTSAQKLLELLQIIFNYCDNDKPELFFDSLIETARKDNKRKPIAPPRQRVQIQSTETTDEGGSLKLKLIKESSQPRSPVRPPPPQIFISDDSIKKFEPRSPPLPPPPPPPPPLPPPSELFTARTNKLKPGSPAASPPQPPQLSPLLHLEANFESPSVFKATIYNNLPKPTKAMKNLGWKKVTCEQQASGKNKIVLLVFLPKLICMNKNTIICTFTRAVLNCSLCEKYVKSIRLRVRVN